MAERGFDSLALTRLWTLVQTDHAQERDPAEREQHLYRADPRDHLITGVLIYRGEALLPLELAREVTLHILHELRERVDVFAL